MNAGPTASWAKLASEAIRAYHRWSPVQRGKHWLLRRSSSFLVAPLGAGLWIRVTGASGFEWKALRGRPCEPVTVAFFRKILTRGMTVFDVGSNVGYYALLAAREVGPSGRVHAFEATPAVAERLTENVTLNRIGNVTVNNTAVCDRLGSIEFRLQEDDSEGNSLVSYGTDWPSVRVPALTLDAYVADRGIERVDVLKIDVEGAEELVFAGAAGLLSGPTPPLLLVESNPPALRAAGSSPAHMRAKLTEFGYQCYDLEQLTAGADPVWNVLAVHPKNDGSAWSRDVRSLCSSTLRRDRKG